jgi:pentatricopeptide repeat domain-containing protein 1
LKRSAIEYDSLTLSQLHVCSLLFLDEMKQHKIWPSSHTFSALFQACSDSSEVSELTDRLRQEYPSITWTPPVFVSAIYACVPKGKSVRYQGGPSTSYIWTVVDRFMTEMQADGMNLTPRTYLALLYVCNETKNISKALYLYEILKERAPVQLTPRLWGAVLQVCAATGKDEQAFEILRSMSEKGVTLNVKHCTNYLNALITANKVGTATNFLYHMAKLRSGSSARNAFDNIVVAAPDMIAIHTVLKACSASTSYSKVLELFKRVQGGDFGLDIVPDQRCYQLLLSACRDPAEAKELIRQMQLSRRYRVGAVPPGHIAYTLAIAVCRKAKDVDSARFFLGSARNNGIAPDLYMYSAAVWAAAGAGDISSALDFLADMEKNGIPPNIVSYNGIIAAYASDGKADEALNIFDETVRKGLDATRTTFFQLAVSVRKVSDTGRRLGLLERITKKIEPNTYSIDVVGPVFEALIATYGSMGKFNDALEVFDSIQGPSDAPCLRAITYACSVATPPAWEDAVSIIHSSDIVGGSAPCYIDQVAIGNVMLACSKANKWEESLQLFGLYGGSGTPIIAMNSLIASCGRGGRPDMAIEVLTEMEAHGLKPNAISYRNAVIACNQAEHDERRPKKRGTAEEHSHKRDEYPFQWWECAVSLLRRMQEDDLHPDIQTYSSVISACEAAGEWQRALGILQSMMNEPNSKERLNLYCFNAAIAACEKGNAWVEAVDIFERMKGEGGRILQPTVVTYGSLILALDTAGQKELAVSMYEEAVRKRIIRPWRFTRDGNGARIRAIDLHQFSAAMARAALRSHFIALLSGKVSTSEEDLTIIVGKGLRSEGEPVLMPSVHKLLLEEYGIRATIDEKNIGRIVLSADALEEMVARNGW